jgi:hypothetical protein
MLVVHALAGIFLKVGSNQSNSFGHILRTRRIDRRSDRYIDMPQVANGQVVLAGLVPFGQIRIEIILAVPFGKVSQLAMKCRTCSACKFNRMSIQDWQGSWES